MPDQDAPVIINSIRHPKCRCTATKICPQCGTKGKWAGKFSKPWADAVKENNENNHAEGR